MTREEAKKILEAYIACESKKAHFECDDYNCDDNCPLRYEMGTVGEHNEAINMAIQALEQEPSEDAISREAVLDTISELNAISFYEAQEDSKECYYEIRQAIKDLSSVKLQEPKTVLYSGDGYADGYMVYDMAECPNCGRKFEYGDETWNCNFCPDCGQALNWERSDKE